MSDHENDSEYESQGESQGQNATGMFPGRALTAELPEDEVAETEAAGEAEPEAGVENEAEAGVENEAGAETELEAEQAPLDPDMTGYLPAVQDPPEMRSDTGFDVPDVEADGSVDDRAVDERAVDDRLGRMQEIQLAFIDDPRKAALDAQNLLEDLLRSLTEELSRQRDTLQNPPLDGAPDTERMRLAVRRSRQLVETLTEA